MVANLHHRPRQVSVILVDFDPTSYVSSLLSTFLAPPAAPESKPMFAFNSDAVQQEAYDLAAAEAEFAKSEEPSSNSQPEIHMKQSTEQSQEWEEEMVPVPVDLSLLSQLTEMGFSDARCRKAIIHGKTMEGSLEWLTSHQNDPDIDQPYMVRKSDAVPKAPLTVEEKAKKIEEMKQLIQKRREEKAKAEKAAEIVREKERRERG
jgi:hypothetical protein